LWHIEKHPAVIPALAEILRDKALSDRFLAASALCELGSVGLPELRKALNDPDPYVRRQAADALAKIGPVGHPAATDLLAMLNDKSGMVRVSAANALWLLDGDSAAIATLAWAVEDPPQFADPARADMEIGTARDAAVATLERIGPQAKAAVPALAKALRDEKWKGRPNAARALEAVGPAAKRALPALVDALKDTDGWTRQTALSAILAIDPDAQAAVPVLEEMLQKEDQPFYRLSIGGALWRMRKYPDALPVFVAVLKEENEYTRADAAAALGQMGPAAKVAVPALVELLGDKEAVVRIAAAKALGAIGTDAKAALPDINKTLIEKELDVRLAAANALWSIDKSPSAISALSEMLKEYKESDRAKITTALGGLGTEAAVPVLTNALKDAQLEVRVRAAEALWRIKKHPSAIPTLIEILKSKNPSWEREPAIKALGAIGPEAKDAVPALVRAFTVDHDDARVEICHALGNIGPESRAAVPAL
jgi:HEAT repeat protein